MPDRPVLAPDAAANTRLIDTDHGPAGVRIEQPTTGSGARGTCFLGHGAGGGFGSPDLTALGTALRADGWTVVWVEQPWLVAGKKVAARPAILDACWHTVVTGLTHGDGTQRDQLPGPYLHGGRSAGARVACRAAAAADPGMPVAALVLCSFPLHPPGKPQNSRVTELAGALRTGIPVGIVQGTRDPFGTAEQIHQGLRETAPAPPAGGARGLVIVEVPGTHSFTTGAAAELNRACATLVDHLRPAGRSTRR